MDFGRNPGLHPTALLLATEYQQKNHSFINGSTYLGKWRKSCCQETSSRGPDGKTKAAVFVCSVATCRLSIVTGCFGWFPPDIYVLFAPCRIIRWTIPSPTIRIQRAQPRVGGEVSLWDREIERWSQDQRCFHNPQPLLCSKAFAAWVAAWEHTDEFPFLK